MIPATLMPANLATFTPLSAASRGPTYHGQEISKLTASPPNDHSIEGTAIVIWPRSWGTGPTTGASPSQCLSRPIPTLPPLPSFSLPTSEPSPPISDGISELHRLCALKDASLLLLIGAGGFLAGAMMMLLLGRL